MYVKTWVDIKDFSSSICTLYPCFFLYLEHSQPVMYNAFFATIDGTIAKNKNQAHNRSSILRIFLQNATVHM
jgi:hypothetical protein